RIATRHARRSEPPRCPRLAGHRLRSGRKDRRGSRAVAGDPAARSGSSYRAGLPEARAEGGARGGSRDDAMSERGFALRFISGKYQGGEYPLPATGELIIGRSSELGMVLIEDMVSRKHARMTFGDSGITISDL